jgi:hypothetical protein
MHEREWITDSICVQATFPAQFVPAFLLHTILSALQVRKGPGIQSALIET